VGLARRGLWQPDIDLPVLAAGAAALAAGIMLNGSFGPLASIAEGTP
jgi:hypothetical protein